MAHAAPFSACSTMKPYSFELAADFPEVFTAIKLPSGKIPVSTHGEFCCYTMVNPDGCVDVLLPEESYLRIKANRATVLLQIIKGPPNSVPDGGRLEELIAIEVVDVI